MKKIIFLSTFLFISISSYAQNNFFFGVGTSATSRLLDFHNKDYSDNEIKRLKKVEVPKPSYFGYIGYSFEYNSKIDLQINLGYRLNRYGSRIYAIPKDIPNITPQYGKTREVVHQNQFNIDLIPKFKSIKLLKAGYFFTKISLVYNHKNYRIYHASFDYKDKKGISGYMGSEGFVPHRFDMYLGTGLSYNLYKERLSFQPSIGAFIRPYETDGAYYSYLFFNKDVKGFLLDIGFNVQYVIK